MGQVYRHGTLNLAATAASGAEDGLNYPLDPFLSRPLRIDVNFTVNAKPPDKGEVITPGSYYVMNYAHVWSSQVDNAPLNTRGWVLQERLFSPRTIHFTRYQLLWQCQNSRMQMIFPDVLEGPLNISPAPFTHDIQGFSQYLRVMRDIPNQRKNSLSHSLVRQAWDRLVPTYTSQKLTREEDKLIAIQAIAQAMEEALEDRYIAGLWESQLVEDLLWAVGPNEQTAKMTRPSTWRAPTWSWASLDGGSLQRASHSGLYVGDSRAEDEGKSLVKSVKASVEGFNDVTTGQLRSASLQIKGRLLRIPRLCKAETLARSEVWQLARGFLMEMARPSGRFFASPDEWDWRTTCAPNYELPLGTFLFVVGTHRVRLIEDDEEQTRAEGLILEETSSSQGLAFCRKGYFAIDDSECGIESLLYLNNEWTHEKIDSNGFIEFTLV